LLVHVLSLFSAMAEKGEGTIIGRRKNRKRRLEHKSLVNKGCARGILVYASDDPVGWCNSVLARSFPGSTRDSNIEDLRFEDRDKKLWRITCFCVDRKYRKKGIASLALRAALKTVRNEGGSRRGISDHSKGYFQVGSELFQCLKRKVLKSQLPLGKV
jgi:GNAT superfamily N-acetyltransferase